MSKQLYEIGDGTTVLSPPEIDATGLNLFDQLENDCWELFKEYCNTLGIQILDVNDGNDEDFYIAKQIQERVLGIIEESGIKLNYEPNNEILETNEMEMSL